VVKLQKDLALTTSPLLARKLLVNRRMSVTAPAIGPRHVLNRNLFFLKNAVKRLEAKTSDKFDIYDPNIRELVLECREPDLDTLTRVRRLAGGQYDSGSPFNFVAAIPGSGEQAFRISRKTPFLSLRRPAIEVYDQNDIQIASLKAKLLSLGHTFRVSIKGSVAFLALRPKGLRGYKMLLQAKEIAFVTPKCDGHEADYFAHGFDYVVSIADDVPPNDPLRPLVLAFALASHRILK
jgi:hypothetical protein